MAVLTGAIAGFVGGFVGAYVSTGSLSASLTAGLISGITGAAFAGVGNYVTEMKLGNEWAKPFSVVGHAAVGCGSAMLSEERYEYLLHDRDSIFAKHLDESIERLGVKVLKSPPRSPIENAVCERVIGTIRRECLDWLIPLSESHPRRILKSWIRDYNGGRPHMSLGPGIPDSPHITKAPAQSSRHRRGESYAVRAASILGGLHHEYSLTPAGV